MTDQSHSDSHATMNNSGGPGAGLIDVIVVGGGLAGLVAAATAARSGRRVVVLDPHPLGGRARVDDRNGFRFNRGPRALYQGGAGRPILDSLGVDTRAGAVPGVPQSQGRHQGELRLLPQGPGSLIRTPLLRPADKIRVGLLLTKFPKLDTKALAGTSFGAFLAEQHLGPTAADLVRMLARVATYAAEPDAADAGAVVGNMQLALAEGVRYLDGGFQAIVDALQATAVKAGVEFRTLAATSVHAGSGSAPPVVHTAQGPISASSVVLATGTPAAAANLLGAPILGADHLSAPVTAACLELGLRRPPRYPVVFGIGEPLYLSTHCPPARLAPPGHAVVHVMRNHAADEPLEHHEQRAWLWAAAQQAGVTEGDVVEQRFLAEMVVTGGMPTAEGGGLPGRPAVTSPERPGILLAGDWVGPVGLLADASVSSGAAAGQHAAVHATTMATP